VSNKPFITNTRSRFSKDIILYENEKIINNQQAVVGWFNGFFFINVAKNIGNNTAAETNHPSIDKINQNKINTSDHKFKEVTEDFDNSNYRPVSILQIILHQL